MNQETPDGRPHEIPQEIDTLSPEEWEYFTQWDRQQEASTIYSLITPEHE